MCRINNISWLIVRLCVHLLYYLRSISLAWETIRKLYAINFMLLTVDEVPRKQAYAWERASVGTCTPLKFVSKVTNLSRTPALCILLLLVDPYAPNNSKRAQRSPSRLIVFSANSNLPFACSQQYFGEDAATVQLGELGEGVQSKRDQRWRQACLTLSQSPTMTLCKRDKLLCVFKRAYTSLVDFRAILCMLILPCPTYLSVFTMVSVTAFSDGCASII